MKVKEIVYYILDAVKNISDDTVLTEDHVIFLIKKYRSFLIKKEQDKDKESSDEASEFETQQICLDLEEVSGIPELPCESGHYLRTTKAIPKVLEGTHPTVYPMDFYSGINISYIPRERMRYTGTNKFLQNIIYVSVGTDGHLYLSSSNPQFLYIKKLKMNATFEDFDEAEQLACDGGVCDILEADFPIREYLIPTLIELVEKEVLGVAYRPADKQNNATDDLSDLVAFIRRNTKNSFQKQIED